MSEIGLFATYDTVLTSVVPGSAAFADDARFRKLISVDSVKPDLVYLPPLLVNGKPYQGLLR